jgi:hypothetical protein
MARPWRFEYEGIKKASHLASDADKTNRSLLIYMLWQSGQPANQHVGEKVGLTYRLLVWGASRFGNMQKLSI